MRISVDEDDSAFLTREERRAYSITLDGELQSDVIMADEELGVVVRLARDERGRLFKGEDGWLKRVEFHGAVRVFKKT